MEVEAEEDFVSPPLSGLFRPDVAIGFDAVDAAVLLVEDVVVVVDAEAGVADGLVKILTFFIGGSLLAFVDPLPADPCGLLFFERSPA